MSLVSPSLWITPVKISASGLYVTGVTVTGVTFLMDNTSEDQCIRSYVCHCVRSLVSPSLWITPVKISASGLMYVTGVTVTGVTFLMDNSSEDQCIGSYDVTGVRSLVSPSLWITPVKISASGL